MNSDLSLVREEGKDEFSYQELTKEDAEKLVPHGYYCYTWVGKPSAQNHQIKVCPFWQSFYPKVPEQSCGFCHLLKVGDFTEDGTVLLWDMIKSCGVNLPDESELS